jgi:hypothetical protein
MTIEAQLRARLQKVEALYSERRARANEKWRAPPPTG